MTATQEHADAMATAVGFASFFICCAAVLIVGIYKTGKWPWE